MMRVITLSEERKSDRVRVPCEVCETGETALKILVSLETMSSSHRNGYSSKS